MRDPETILRDELKLGIAQCTEDQQHFFKRMYSHKDTSVTVAVCVDNMDRLSLNTAIMQVKRTLEAK